MAINAARAVLRQGKTVLLICDIQEKFAKAMFEFDKIVQNSSKLVNMLIRFLCIDVKKMTPIFFLC